jgi:hypothetical protein
MRPTTFRQIAPTATEDPTNENACRSRTVSAASRATHRSSGPGLAPVFGNAVCLLAALPDPAKLQPRVLQCRSAILGIALNNKHNNVRTNMCLRRNWRRTATALRVGFYETEGLVLTVGLATLKLTQPSQLHTTRHN